MEYAKESAKCLKCKEKKELYASQCKHLDPICLTCATKMAKDKTPCSTCRQPFTKVFRRYDLKPCAPGSTSKFLAKFLPKPSGSVEIVGVEKEPPAAGQSNTDSKYFRKSDKRSWIMYKEGAEGKRYNSKTDSRPWILENVKDEGKYRGKQKLVDNNMYYMVQFEAKRIGKPLLVYPIKKWYEFESEIQYKTLTTEEAENIMNSRKRNEEGHASWITKGKGKNDDIEDVDGQHENDETRKKQINEEDDSDHDEEKMSNPDENDLPKGEDWEHEEEFTDDDDVQPARSASVGKSESDVPSDMSDFENEKVSEFGKEIKSILKKERLGEKDANKPVEKDENNDASNSLDDKDRYDGKDQKKAKKQDDELKDARVAEKPRTEQRPRKRKGTERNLQESETHQGLKKAKHTSEGKSQESEAQKKENDISAFKNRVCEFLRDGPKEEGEMKDFLRKHTKGVIFILVTLFYQNIIGWLCEYHAFKFSYCHG